MIKEIVHATLFPAMKSEAAAADDLRIAVNGGRSFIW